MRHSIIAPALALVAALCWAGNWVVGRAVAADIPAFGLTFWRFALASALLLPFVVSRLRAELPVIVAHWKVIVALGVLNATLFQTMIYIGLQYTTALNALLLSGASPLFTILIARIAVGEAFSLRKLSGMVLSFVGAGWLLLRGDLETLLALQFNRGDLWVLAAMFVWGVYSVLLRFRPAALPGPSLIFAISLVGVVTLLPLWAWELSRGLRMPLDTGSLAAVVYVAVFASIVALLAFNEAVARMGAASATIFLHFMPVFGSVLAMAFLGERLAAYHLIGFPLVLAGVLWATTGRRPN